MFHSIPDSEARRSRRQFIEWAGALTVGAACGGNLLAAGQGKLDYDRYLSLLHKSGFSGPLLLHGLSEAQVPGCVAFLREKLARLALAPAQPTKSVGTAWAFED
jgi:sugar phosphate isomerase/epimerase